MTWNPGFGAREPELDGTERHTLPDAPAALHPAMPAAEIERPPASSSLFDSFFSEGDEGRYAGGPATVEPVELELDEPPEPVVLRTPEMDARRARFTRAVAVGLGCLAALFAVGLTRQALRAPHALEASPVAAAPAANALTRPVPVVVAPAPAAPATPAAAEHVAPVVAAPVVAQPVAAPVVAAPVVADKPAPKPATPVSKPAPRVAAVAPVAPAPAPVVAPSTKPSVASFAAKTPIPASVRASIPTASF